MRNPFRLGDFRVEPDLNRLSGPLGTVSVEPQVMRLLGYLAERPGQVVRKDELVRDVWDGAFVGDDAITYAIGEIRRALADDPRQPRFIETIPKRGYRLVAKVTPTTEGPGDGGPETLPPDRSPAGWGRWRWVAGALGIAAIAGAIGYRLGRDPAATPTIRHLQITLAAAPIAGDSYTPFAALDDHRLVYSDDDDYFLRIHDLRSNSTRPLVEGEGAWEPFASPDGLWVAFWTTSGLKKVSTAGGAPVRLCEARDLLGGSWGSDGSIAFAPDEGTGLRKVSAEGGAAQPLTVVDPDAGEVDHYWPQFLPGRAVLFTVRTASPRDPFRIAVERLDTGERRVLVEGASRARYLPTGHLVYARAGTLYGAGFDLERLALRGPSVALVSNVRTLDGAAQFEFTRDGTLIYIPTEPVPRRTLAWVDRRGIPTALPFAPRAMSWPRLDHTGSRVAVNISDGTRDDIWVYDLTKGALTRVTMEGVASPPIWSPDGRAVTFTTGTFKAGAGEAGSTTIVNQPVEEGRPPQKLLDAEQRVWPGPWLPDGSALLVSRLEEGGDIALFRLGPPPKLAPLVGGPSDQWGASLSPDGDWFAYVSDESGRFEVHVASLPGAETRRQITTEGGTGPVWSPDGREIFYRAGNHLMTIAVRTGSTFVASEPKGLFEWHGPKGAPGVPNFDVSPDGRFLMIGGEDGSPLVLHVVDNWFADLYRLIPP
jgi:eukaryotic-like serine/threonine-protein kinase